MSPAAPHEDAPPVHHVSSVSPINPCSLEDPSSFPNIPVPMFWHAWGLRFIEEHEIWQVSLFTYGHDILALRLYAQDFTDN